MGRRNSDLQRKIPRDCIHRGFGFGIFVYTIWSFFFSCKYYKGVLGKLGLLLRAIVKICMYLRVAC
jgi:hypothetical protein